MADPQPARGRAPSNALPMDLWVKWRNGLLDLEQKLDRSPTAKRIFGEIAAEEARPAGVLRGVAHTAEDLVKGGMFVSRLINPLDAIASPPGRSAANQLTNGAVAAYVYGKRVAADPSIAKADVKRAASAAYRSIEPSATPMAPTLAEEIQRRQRLGKNQGETAFDIASLAYGGPAVKGLTAFPRAAEELAAMDRLVAAATPRQAARLTGQYSGKYHHFVPERYTGWMPQVMRDNPFFVYKPDDVSQLEFYRRHFKIDPEYFGGPFPERGSWSGNDLGWTKFGLLDRHAFGMPAPTRALVLGNAASASDSAYGLAQGDQAP